MIKEIRYTFNELQGKVNHFLAQNKNVPSELMSDFQIAKAKEEAQQNLQTYAQHINKDGFYRY